MQIKSIVEELQEFSQCLERKNVVFYYMGYFSQSIITAMADAVKMRIEHHGAEKKTSRKIFSSFIELAQNIVHYSSDYYSASDTPEGAIRHGALLIIFKDERYYLYCTNPVQSEVAARLHENLEHLNSLSNDEIRQEYKEMLRKEAPPESKGAGLGLLTIARDASEPLQHEFRPTDTETISAFYLKAVI